MQINPKMFRMIRVFYGLTQQEFADLIGCSVSLVSKIEKEQRSLTYEVRARVRELFPLTDEVIARISTLQTELIEGVSI